MSVPHLDGNHRLRLRPLEAIPFEHDGERRIAWRDPMGISPTVEVAQPVAVLMSLFDGSRTGDEVRAAWLELAGEDLAPEFVPAIEAQLEEHVLVDGPSFRRLRAETLDAWRRLAVRPPAHCPGAYPEDPAECASWLDDLLRQGRSQAHTLRHGTVRGIVAPHIDLERGGVAYGAAYDCLRDSEADLFIVLGIAHSSSIWPDPPPLAILTRLDFDTPLGTVQTDRGFIDRLVGHYAAAGGDPEALFADELVHRSEHSVEFQTLFLQHLHGGREFRIVPILLGSLHAFYDCPDRVAGGDGLGPLLHALRAATAEHTGEVCLVAGADLAHVGPRFGADKPVEEGDLDAIAERDLDALRRFVDHGADEFFAHFAEDGNTRNVCSVSNLYALRALLPAASAELLRWDVAYDPSQSVSFAALALR